MTKDTIPKLIGPFRQLLTMNGLPLKGALNDASLECLEEAGILLSGEQILEVGDFKTLEAKVQAEGHTIERLTEDLVLLPGFIDAHTHICFGGSRERDYALRTSGKTYLEIAKAGGGIWDTVTQTRKASKDSLIAKTVARATRHLQAGVTTLEVKSGYGLTVAEELKMLYAIKEAATQSPADLVPTCLAAHMVPRDFEGSPTDYLDLVAEQLFPILKAEGLANRVDAFVEQSAFDADQIGPYFQKAREMGFRITVHADQFTPGGSKVAIKHHALSADHLEASTEEEIQALAQSDVIAMALPGATLGLGCGFTPARKLLDAGACLAIASDWNPGSAPMGQLLTQAALIGAFEKLSTAEVLAGITVRAAAALELNDRGILAAGKLADLVAFPAKDHREILYQQGSLAPARVWKRGTQITF